MNDKTTHIREFGTFRLDAERRVLWCGSKPVNLPLKGIELLCVLTEAKGEVVTKDELLNKVWADAYVEESNLSRHIYVLRETFKSFGENDMIQTVPRRGYRFTAEVRNAVEPALIVEKHTLTRTLIEIEDAAKPALTVPRSLSRRAVYALSIVAASVLLGASVFLVSKNGESPAVVPSDRSVNTIEHLRFADNGRVVTDFGSKVEKARAVALQPDGKIVVGGWAGESEGVSDFAVARYEADGSLDQTFGGDGKVITAVGSLSDVIYALAVQPDGKIVVAGVSFGGDESRRFCVARYKPDGALDAGFDGDGIVTLNIGTTLRDTAYAVAIQPDGKIVVAGSASKMVVTNDVRLGHNDFGLVRLNADGSIDMAFGTGGSVITNFGYGVDVIYALALQPDGKIIAAGNSTNGQNNDFAMARYTSDGLLDQDFGSGGKVRTDFFVGDDMATSLALQTDGKIVLAGYALRSSAADFAVARYTQDGSLDNTFNGNGKMTLDIDDGYDVALGVKIQPDGRIVVNGQANIRNDPQFALARLFADGTVDQTLGGTGKTRIPFETPGEAWGLVLLPEGFALSVGSTGDSKLSDFALARFPLN